MNNISIRDPNLKSVFNQFTSWIQQVNKIISEENKTLVKLTAKTYTLETIVTKFMANQDSSVI